MAAIWPSSSSRANTTTRTFCRSRQGFSLARPPKRVLSCGSRQNLLTKSGTYVASKSSANTYCMVEIVPAVLPKNFKDLEKHFAAVRPGASGSSMGQIDVVDGVFARNRTWPYRDESSFTKIVADEKGLPFWEEFDYQFDLMIDHPE